MAVFRNLRHPLLFPLAIAGLLAFLLPAGHAYGRTRHHAKPAKTESAKATPSATASPTPSGSPEPLPVVAQGAEVLDVYTGRTVFEKSANDVFFPASTTKILTALLVIEAGHLDDQVTIAPEDTKVEPSSLEMKPGEKYTRREMLYGLMLKSANDVAQALARDNAGSIEAFADKMTRRAHELGAASSQFKNPHGLPNKDHYTTPHDLALIARAAMQQPFFRKVVGTMTHPWTSATGIEELKNHNKLLWEYPGCTGLKTGYTYAAQQVLVSSALKDGREVISVVMHTNHPGIWEDSKMLLSYGLAHLPPDLHDY